MTVNVAQLLDVGPGVAGFTGWIVAFFILLFLAGIARWATRPAKRVPRPRPGVAPDDLSSLDDLDRYRAP